ncbi:unnamed protein product [Linum trigynum]|uniref:TF-B3 domain-containing protein n=1 Tax=Linum trigynum TaxID=586398 RepID=A0AAV2CKN3_9ROSI
MAEEGGGREIRPIVGNPYFHFVVTEGGKRAVVVPKKISDLLPCSAVQVSVACGGKWWRMTYQGNWYFKRIQDGWPKFVDDNRIRVGDACVFEVLDRGSRGTKVKFAVQILRGNVAGRVGGRRASTSREVLPAIGNGQGTDPNDPIILG